MLSPDRERIKSLICETITMLCKNGLHYDQEFRIDALIGITLDKTEVFLISMNEFVRHGSKFTRCTDRQSILDDEDTTDKRIASVNELEKDSTGSHQFQSIIANASKGRSMSHTQHSSEHLEACTDNEASLTERDSFVDQMHASGTRTSDMDEGMPSMIGAFAERAVGTLLFQPNPGALPFGGEGNFGSADDIDSIQSSSNSAADPGTAIASEVRSCAQNERRAKTSGTGKDIIDESNGELVMSIKQEPGVDSLNNPSHDKESVHARFASTSTPCTSRPNSFGFFPHNMFDDQYSCFSNAKLLKSRLMPSQNIMPRGLDSSLARMSGFQVPSSMFKSEIASDSDDPQMAFSLSDEDGSQYYRHRRQRSTFSPNQIAELELAFAKSHYLTWEIRTALATKLQLSHNVIGIWFQNRRQRLKNNLRTPR